MTSLRTIPESIGNDGLFCDGDWVESKDQDPQGDVRLIQLADIGVGTFVNKSARFMTAAKAKALRCTYLKPGDILIARMPDPLGRACIFPGDAKPCVTVVDVCIVRPDSKLIDSNYLVQCINSDYFQKQIRPWITGTTRQRISRGNLSNIPIPIPGLQEQKRIAAVLDKAYSIRHKRQQAIALADQLLHSVFLNMFGDPVTNQKGWRVQEIHSVCAEVVDCVNRTAPVVERQTPYKMIRTTNIRNFEIDTMNVRYAEKEIYETWVRRLRPKPGDIFFTREAPAGEAGILRVDEKVFLGQRTMHFRPDFDKVTAEFLLHELMAEGIKRQIRKIGAGSTVTHLSVPECKTLKVRVPPIQLQRKFREIERRLFSAKAKHQTSLEFGETLSLSLAKETFSF